MRKAVGCKLNDEYTMKEITIIALLLMNGIILFGQNSYIPQSFKHLKKVELENEFHTTTFENPKVFIDAESSIIINKPVDSTSIFYSEFSNEIGLHEFVVTKIDKSRSDQYYILFDYGMSADPNFTIAKKEDDSYKVVASISGLTLYIPGNGNLYCEGHTNNYFNERKKYQLKNDSLIRVEQPFKYVGIKTRTKGILKLYADKNKESLVATLPSNAEIEVLINDKDYYLIKTSFGLVGWWQFNGYYSDIIKEIYFKGD